MIIHLSNSRMPESWNRSGQDAILFGSPHRIGHVGCPEGVLPQRSTSGRSSNVWRQVERSRATPPFHFWSPCGAAARSDARTIPCTRVRLVLIGDPGMELSRGAFEIGIETGSILTVGARGHAPLHSEQRQTTGLHFSRSLASSCGDSSHYCGNDPFRSYAAPRPGRGPGWKGMRVPLGRLPDLLKREDLGEFYGIEPFRGVMLTSRAFDKLPFRRVPAVGTDGMFGFRRP